MDDSGYLLMYPVFLIGRHAAEKCRENPSLLQHWATTEVNQQRALMIFSEPLHAERLMIAETVAANVVPVETPAELADIIRRNRRHFTMILVDANMTTGIGRAFTVDEFLACLPS